MILRWTLRFGVCLVLALRLTESYAAAQVADVRLQVEPGSTRVEFMLSEPVDYTWFTLDNPDRVVLDLRATHALDLLLRGVGDQGAVARIRHAPRNAGDLRIVLDLRGPVQANATLLRAQADAGDRIVVDLHPTQAAGTEVPRAASLALPVIPIALPAATRTAAPAAVRSAAPAAIRTTGPAAVQTAATTAPDPVAPGDERAELQALIAELKQMTAAYQEAARDLASQQARLEQRVRELETARSANETATRAIIRDSVGSLGSNINEAVALSGSLEVQAGRQQNFVGPSDNTLALSTAELDLEIRPNEWVLGELIVDYNDGSGTRFTTTDGTEAGIDRITVNTASITAGDTQRFPAFARAGRVTLPFGIATGKAGADVLSLNDPLTVEVFETRRDAIQLGAAFPTPAPQPATPPITPPRVRPLVLAPAVEKLGAALGYAPPPTRPAAITPITPPPPRPPFSLGVYVYNGETVAADGRTGFNPERHFGARSGLNLGGTCGRRLDEPLPFFCPWTLDVALDFNRSVYDSLFLSQEYQPFLPQIGLVPGLAASVKAGLGPFALVGEWNGAIDHANFVDDAGRTIHIRPSSWQVSLGYQFDWNPWVERVGDQGTFVAVGYSESVDLAGVTRLIGGEASRVGSVPRQRLLLTAGEWVSDGLRLTAEYSYEVDYGVAEGGTGQSANAIFTALTYIW